jgi:hypothetical protein
MSHFLPIYAFATSTLHSFDAIISPVWNFKFLASRSSGLVSSSSWPDVLFYFPWYPFRNEKNSAIRLVDIWRAYICAPSNCWRYKMSTPSRCVPHQGADSSICRLSKISTFWTKCWPSKMSTCQIIYH